MPHTQAEQSVSEVGVSLDPASLRGQSSSNDTRYTIAVRGRADEHWADAYLSVQGESVPHRRFQLDRRSRRIAFNCPTVEGPAFVFEMLERLEELLAVVDRRLDIEGDGATLVSPTPPAPRTLPETR